MVTMIVYWLCFAEKRLYHNALNASLLGYVFVVVGAWLGSDCYEEGWLQVEKTLKTFVFFCVLITSIRTESDLRLLIFGFLASMAIYLAHSAFEYRNGRHVYRMGTARMIGVDTTLGDPNSFAASIVYSIPFSLCLMNAVTDRKSKTLLVGYTILSVACVFLTGSRTGLVGLLTMLLLAVLWSRRRLMYIFSSMLFCLLLLPLLPEDRLTRFLTIIDSSQGPANARASADSRSDFFFKALELWRESPIIGHGPGSFAVKSGVGQPAHTLYGEVLAELGLLGCLAMFAVLMSFVLSHYLVSCRYGAIQWRDRGFLFWSSMAIQLSILLHLVLGLGGHNTYRYTWLWFGAFQILITEFSKRQTCNAVDDDSEVLDSGIRSFL